MNIDGNTKPNMPPNACARTRIVRAMTLSFGENHTFATFAGAFNKKG